MDAFLSLLSLLPRPPQAEVWIRVGFTCPTLQLKAQCLFLSRSYRCGDTLQRNQQPQDTNTLILGLQLGCLFASLAIYRIYVKSCSFPVCNIPTFANPVSELSCCKFDGYFFVFVSFFSPLQQRNLEGYVGFANLPNQVYRKSVKRGFEFTLMVVGKLSQFVCVCARSHACGCMFVWVGSRTSVSLHSFSGGRVE